MLFNSVEFLIFFPVVTVLYFLIPHKLRWLHLLIASCIFYVAFIPVYLLILFFTIVIDYVAGILIERNEDKKRKHFLFMSIVANVGVLAIFKYYNFFISNMNEVLQGLHITSKSLPYLDIILPIGLSFHTFQAMSYTIEVYRGNQKAEKHFGIYSLYVMFYPQLVAGPIERPQNLLHQFREKHFFNSQHLLDGLRLMLWGFFKKVVIADRLAQYVNLVYKYPEHYHYGNLIVATLFFSIQIYCDFSGYSDIAIGAAKTMGFNLMTNFNRPYFSKNIREFWRRWHISLSTWFKDYVYVTLGGNRKGLKKVYVNTAFVFLLSGFWHGAKWTFVLWGAIHAVFIIFYLYFSLNAKKSSGSQSPFIKLASVCFTFVLASFAWIFFRATDITDAGIICRNIFTRFNNTPFQFILKDITGAIMFTKISMIISLVVILFMLIVERYTTPDLAVLNKKPYTDIVFCTATMVIILLLGVFNHNSFIYFQF